ncbi:MAG: hypothetical protein MJ177_02650, partial [Clostridia bacterium]|nr:hypothetical protein [Clostridia bacterium]
LYTLLDKLMKISLAGAIIDVIPWFFYDLTEAKQKSVIRIIRIRSAVEDRNEGVVTDELYCEACEAVMAADEYFGKEKLPLPDRKSADKKRKKEIAAYNEEIEIAGLVNEELHRFETPFGLAFRASCVKIYESGKNGFCNRYDDILAGARALPQGETKQERNCRINAVRNAKSVKKSSALIKKYYPDGDISFSVSGFEAAFDMPEDTKEERKAKRAAIKKAKAERNIYARVMKPYLFAGRNAVLAAEYDNINGFISDYDEVNERLEQSRERQRIEAQEKAQRRREETKKRIKK